MRLLKKICTKMSNPKWYNIGLIVCFMLTTTHNLHAEDEGVPLDAGVSFLVAAAVGYGVKQMAQKEEV